MTSSSFEHEKCRVCDSPLRPILNLGPIYPSNFVDEDIGQPQPLELMECIRCELPQLKHTLSMDSMYRQYWYRSGLNPTMVDALRDIVNGVMDRVSLDEGDLVVDIGCNDGTMLSMYPEHIHTIGFDPALNLADLAAPNCDLFINDYFGLGLWLKHIGWETAKVVTCIAMFYDLDDPRWFLSQVHRFLDQNGIFVIQLGDLMSMMRQNAFDNICHEHLVYYPFRNLMWLLQRFGFHVFDVEWNNVNGGSVRIYATKDSIIAPKTRAAINEALALEGEYFARDSMREFAERVELIKEVVVGYLRGSQTNDLRTHILGASTKGNTLLQVFGIDNSLIEAAAEINPEKYGKYTVGTHIPIIPEKESMASRPDQYLVLPWHFIDGFVERNWEYLAAGGQFLVPLPEPTLINAHFGKVRKITVADFLKQYGDTAWQEMMGETLR